MRAHRVVILHVTFEDMAQVLLACHHDVVQAFPADRADQALGISVLPRRARRRRMIANAERANATICRDPTSRRRSSDSASLANWMEFTTGTAALRSEKGFRRKSSPSSESKSKARATASCHSLEYEAHRNRAHHPIRATTSASRITLPPILPAASTIRG
jgi:hypothetical protein